MVWTFGLILGGREDWHQFVEGSDLHGDAGELSPPSVGVLMVLESGMGRGTGRATGGGGGSRKELGILLWPPPLGCRWTTDRIRKAHPKNIQWTGSLTHSQTYSSSQKKFLLIFKKHFVFKLQISVDFVQV